MEDYKPQAIIKVKQTHLAINLVFLGKMQKQITYIYIVIPPISILLLSCDTKTELRVCFHNLIELISESNGKQEMIIPISSLSLPINTINDINAKVITNLQISSF